MEIINNLNEKRPKFSYDEWLKSKPLDNASQLEKDRFVDQEINRWIKGHKGLTGRHYAYLTQGSLKTVTGQIIKPRWRDGDSFILEQGEEARRLGEDEMIIKRREFGLTSMYAGFEPIYNSIINSGSTCLITSADKTRVQNAFSEKVLPMYENLDKNFKSPRISSRQSGYLHLGTQAKDGTTGGIDSKVICVETASSDSNARAFENYRAMYIFLDELFLHPRAKIVHNSAQACLMEGFVKKGHMIFGGSCGASTVQEAEMLKTGAILGEQLWSDAAALGIRTMFIPGWMCIEQAPEIDDSGKPTGKIINFCKNGISDEKKATEWILRKRDRLEKAEDKTPYYNFIKQYPLTIDEVFEINRAAYFTKDIYDNLNRAKKSYYEEGEPVGIFSLYNQGGFVKKEPDKRGLFHILEEAKPNEEYICGMDPIPFGHANPDEGSDHLITVKARYAERYVAFYSERNMDPDLVVGNCIMLQEMYKSDAFPQGAPVNIERNRAEVTLRVYDQLGKNHLLSRQPTHLGIDYVDKKAKYGWYNNDKTLARGNGFIHDYLKRHAADIRFIKLILELQRYPTGNNDFMDAMRSCEILDTELVAVNKIKYIPVATRRQSFFTRDALGRTVVKWRDVEIK